MNTENTVYVDPETDNLEEFELLLNGRATEGKPDEATDGDSNKDEAKDANALTDEESNVEDGETDDNTATDSEDNNDDAEEKAEVEDDALANAKPKKRFQERINELTAKARNEERRANELEQKLNEIIARLDKVGKTEEVNEPSTTAQGPKEPTPDDLDDKGNPKYPLGEFDPSFIRDTTRYTIAIETARIEQERQQKAEQARLEQEQETLNNEWNNRLEEASNSKYPDLLEKTPILQETFENINPEYGQFLANTIMSMDYGVDVLYHLANNVGEAKAIVAMGPARAAVALGRLEALFAYEDAEKQERTTKLKLKVSNAPPPPPELNRGSSVTIDIPDDTDDLDAFEKKLWAKKRR